MAVQARQTLEETRWLLELADAPPVHRGRGGLGGSAGDDRRAQLARVLGRPKLVGVRHIVQAEPDDRFLLRPDVPARRSAAPARASASPTTSSIYPRHLPVGGRVRRGGSRRQRFVLDHLAKPDIRRGRDPASGARDLRALAACPNVSCKLSGLVTEADWQSWTPEQIRPYLDVAFECFGAERLMIGSDWPVCTLAARLRAYDGGS